MKALISTILITTLVAVFCSGEAQAVGGEDIVLAMPFEEGEGGDTMDISPYGNHGTLMENASWGVGKFGNAVQFEPVGYVDAGNDESLSPAWHRLHACRLGQHERYRWTPTRVYGSR